MKKTISFRNWLVASLAAAGVLFVSCTSTKVDVVEVTKVDVPEVNVEFDILSLNDTHGYLETTNSASISKIAAYMANYGEDALRISSGDMFQGTGVSNLTKGRAMIEVMNDMNFDCMVVGNHEFDWGIETVLAYFDGIPDNGEANFPLLAANIVDAKGKSLKYAVPYMIKEINGARIGVIGIIGEDLENAISVKALGGYQFTEARPQVEKYAALLKETLGCNMVIVATHCGSEFNHNYEGLGVDLVINGHTHKAEIGLDAAIPYIQSGRYANNVGHTVSDVDFTDVTIKSMENVSIKTLTEESESVNAIVAQYKESLTPVLNEPICIINNFSRDNISKYSTKMMKKLYKLDAAFVNGGAYRTTWEEGLNVTYSNLLEMIPFDDEVKTCNLKGVYLKQLADLIVVKHKDIVSDTVFTIDGDNYYMDGKLIDDNKTYKVGAIDYVFDKKDYPFVNGTGVYFTTEYIRDLLNDNFKKAGTVNLSVN